VAITLFIFTSKCPICTSVYQYRSSQSCINIVDLCFCINEGLNTWFIPIATCINSNIFYSLQLCSVTNFLPHIIQSWSMLLKNMYMETCWTFVVRKATSHLVLWHLVALLLANGPGFEENVHVSVSAQDTLI
jgi:hypothetical protein